MNSALQTRQPHAVLDLPSRGWKALKIAQLLNLFDRQQPIRMLEIGTGSGGVAHWFANHAELRCNVTAVDVHDSRLVHEGYDFQLVHDTVLPFIDGSFDVVITNHVIEHVGDAAAQLHHLKEVRRVMCPGGVGYLAVPNRWMLTEPHYRLKFLSWWPHSWRTPYLRLMRKGKFYDCEPLEMRELERMLDLVDFSYQNLCIEAWRATMHIERPGRLSTCLLTSTPDALLRPLLPLIPTLIYRLSNKTK